MFVCAYYDAKDNVKHVKSMQNKIQVGAASACYASKQSLYHGNEKHRNIKLYLGLHSWQHSMSVLLHVRNIVLRKIEDTLYHCPMCNLSMHSGCM